MRNSKSEYLSELFEKDSDTIGWHLKNIYKSEELDEFSTAEKYSVVRKEGERNVKRQIKFKVTPIPTKRNETTPKYPKHKPKLQPPQLYWQTPNYF